MGSILDNPITQTQMTEGKKQANVTKLAPVDPNQVYNANKDAGSILGTDLEAAYKNLAFGGQGGGGAGAPVGTLSLANRSNEFGDFQAQTTKYTSDLMKNAGDTANGMFGQGTLNQITGDNDQVVQADIAKLQEQFGGNVNHPAFIKAKNEMLATARMFNARAYTDLKTKAAVYGVQVGQMAANYYDIYSTKEENQQKLKIAVDQFNIEQQQAAANRASGAASQAFGQQLAALNALQAFRGNEADMATGWANTELEARSADKVSRMNLDLEMRKMDVAESTAKAKESSGIWSAIIGGIGSAIPIIGPILFPKKT